MLLQAIMTEVCDTLESLECISVVVYMSACCCRRADRTAGSAVPTVEASEAVASAKIGV